MKKNKKYLIIFMLISFCIIVFESLNTFYLVKSIEVYEEFKKITDVSFDVYVNIQKLNYFSSITIYIIFTIYNYFLWEKVKQNILYKGIFVLFMLANILFKIFVYQQYNIFSILSIISQIILVVIILLYERE